MRTFVQRSKATQEATSAKTTIHGRAHVGRRSRGDVARLDHDLSRIPIYARAALKIQPKLTVNTPGDAYEQEADQVADKVMRMPEPPVQRTCPRCQTERSGQEDNRVQTKRLPGSDTAQIAAPPIIHEVLSAPGHPLDPATRAYMEPRFGYDFSQVRVHDDSHAAASAQSVSALAYTVGSHIVLGAGQHSPSHPSHQQTLAHELAHVIQQNASASPETLQRKPSQGIHEIRGNEDFEKQRLDAIEIITQYRDLINDEAKKHDIPPEAIAGAILWEALENPYTRPLGRRGPGKIRSVPDLYWGKAESQKAEEAGLIERPAATEQGAADTERAERLMKPGWALRYAAAIMRRHANDYKKIAGVDISKNAGVLCTLFQVGDSEGRAQKLAETLKTDPSAKPEPNDKMGQWVIDNAADIKALLVKRPEFDNPPQIYIIHPTIKAEAEPERAVFVRKGKGDSAVHYPLEIRSGGSPSWLTNNPGLLEYEIARKIGPYPYDGLRLVHKQHRIAVYSSRERGLGALKNFIRQHQGERNLRLIVETIPLLTATTKQAAAALAQGMGLPETTLVKSLSDAQLTQLATEIEKIQGWTVGRTAPRTK